MSDATTPENLPDLDLTPEEKQWAEHFVTEALIRGAELREAVAGQVHVKGFTCPYCDTMSLSFEAAHDHDGVCDKHPMAERAKEAEARLKWLAAHSVTVHDAARKLIFFRDPRCAGTLEEYIDLTREAESDNA